MGRMPKDMRQLMQQAQKMQEQMQQAQSDLAQRTYEATAGGGVGPTATVGAGWMLTAIAAAQAFGLM